jgi:hypothetical protein
VAESLGSLCTLPRGLLWRGPWWLGLWVFLLFFFWYISGSFG